MIFINAKYAGVCRCDAPIMRGDYVGTELGRVFCRACARRAAAKDAEGMERERGARRAAYETGVGE